MSGLLVVDNGHIIVKRGNNSINFNSARQDMSTPVSYVAWISSEDDYIIMEHDRTDIANTTMKYFHATIAQEAFQDAWDDRDNKVYVEYNALF